MSLAAPNDLPLAVDLDGTLIRSDLLAESGNAFLMAHPTQAWRLPLWLARGRARLKGELARRTDIDVTTLPYDEELLGWLRDQRAAGRRLILATASHHLLARRVADHLGCFDEVLASDDDHNLKGAAKAQALVARHGERGFDYVGDHRADLAIWRHARHAYVAGGDSGLVRQAGAAATSASMALGAKRPSLFANWARALRLYQWLKNLLVLVPLMSAHRYGDPQAVLASLLAVGCFGLAASAIYLINDMSDLEDDRRHERKRRRPFAAGALPLAAGWVAAPTLILIAAAGAWLGLPHGFFVVLLIYLALTSAYSFHFKRLVALDVITLATLYTLRLVAGAEAIGVPISFWALTFSLFVFTSLALIKRYSELKSAREAGKRARLPGRGYHPDDLEMVSALGAAAGYISVLVLALYVQDPATAMLYPAPRVLWLSCPLLLYWISRVWLIAHRGGMHDDPVVFALRDRASLIVGFLFLAVFALARLGA